MLAILTHPMKKSTVYVMGVQHNTKKARKFTSMLLDEVQPSTAYLELNRFSSDWILQTDFRYSEFYQLLKPSDSQMKVPTELIDISDCGINNAYHEKLSLFTEKQRIESFVHYKLVRSLHNELFALGIDILKCTALTTGPYLQTIIDYRNAFMIDTIESKMEENAKSVAICGWRHISGMHYIWQQRHGIGNATFKKLSNVTFHRL